MFDLDNWQEIWVTITRNKLRSFLTGFGVFWGLFMLIILIGVGNGFKGGIMQNMEGIASNSCLFWTERTSEPYKGYRKGRRWSMNNNDLALIRQKASTVADISPMLWQNGSLIRGLKTASYNLRGIYPAHYNIEHHSLLKGRLISGADIEHSRKVCVIGKEAYETLFNVDEDPIGQYIRANGIYFQVIGVIKRVSNSSITGNPERQVFMPFTTMQRLFMRDNSFYFMACTAKKGYPASAVEDEVRGLLKEAHDISPTDEKAVGGFNIEKAFRIYQNLFTGVDVLVWIVGLGALFSGIIGISNIMLVTVRERMREIGVRRALGAKPIAIIMQILSESFVLTTIAGVSGFLLGIGILELVQKAMGEGAELFIPPTVSFNLALVAMLVLIVSGVIAGIMPAMRALQIKAIDAIRDE